MLNVRRGVTLAPYTTFGIGGPADYFVEAHSIEEIVEAVNFAREKSLPFFILGAGANILVGDKGFRGVVIKNKANRYQISNIKYPISNKKVALTAESGATIADLIEITAKEGLSGLEHFAGIPSSVGGALWQNLHFLSPDRSQTVFIGDIVTEAQVLQISNIKYQISNVSRDYFNFSYDYSILHDTHDVVLSVTFLLEREKREIIESRINANLLWRAEKHPENAIKTSAGSIFKKIPARNASASVAGGEGGAGRFIQQVGLKGYRIGGAKISDKHANFIINENSATAKDVRELIALVQTKVKEQLGLSMQTEISFIGEF